ncbi:hypothetical protein [Halotia branconii]|uniref:Uncharacterized protein n=1 Tax=Halotia branconii CENA392 TaxID=1539056 RepID=A0AAJ6NSB5_9CYAN|nr:hypothetical protein [Halotia branconii]WGV25643.1 hypothetical protein QI031_28640 [Halotia branconii CENA392]
MKKQQQINKSFISLSRRAFWVTLSLFTTVFVVFVSLFKDSVQAQNAPTVNQLTCNDNFSLVKVIIIALAITLAVLIIVFGGVIVWLGKDDRDKTLEELFQVFFSRDSNTLQIFTVGTLVFSTLFLALTDRLSDGVLAFFGAIVGFVLGIAQSPQQSPKNHITQTSQEGQGNKGDSE